MGITTIILILAPSLGVLLWWVYAKRSNSVKNENLKDEFENLTASQIKQQFETLQKHRNNLSEDFIKQLPAEQQKTVERIQKIDEKLERLRDILADRGEFEFLKDIDLNS